jgi:hypothetical protein
MPAHAADATRRIGMPSGWRGLLAALVASLLAGCAGYRLGPTNGATAGARSIQIDFFQNLTEEPRLSEAVAQALRKRFQQEGTFRLATRDDGDIVLSGSILRYERSALSFQPGDLLTARDFDVVLHVQITAQERATGRKLLDREVRGRTTVRVVGNLPSAERQALPSLADDLAYNAAALLVDGTW